MISETISYSMFQSVQCKNVLQRVQHLVTVYMKLEGDNTLGKTNIWRKLYKK